MTCEQQLARLRKWREVTHLICLIVGMLIGALGGMVIAEARFYAK